MSAEISKAFTANKNIRYLQHYFTNTLPDSPVKEQILETLIETLFSFYDHEIIENNTYRLRNSVDLWNEVRKLNQAFIDDRLALVAGYKDIGTESYHMNMFIDDSLQPAQYEHLNDPYKEDYNKRIFRYEDPDDPDRSFIPVKQILNKRHVDTDIDELFDSEVSKIRSAPW
jgi:hypothetical protein